MSTIPEIKPGTTPTMQDFNIHVEGVKKMLLDLKTNKAPGPDDIPPRILKDAAEHIAPILTKIFQISLDSGLLPKDWKNENVSPIYKKGDRIPKAAIIDQYPLRL